MAKRTLSRNVLGFTIVELLVVIVIIGILASITMVSYTLMTKKANEAVVISDLATAKNQFALYYTEHSVYPTGLDANNCPTNATVTPNPDTNYCLKSGSGGAFAITDGNGLTYTLTDTKGDIVYKVTDGSSPEIATAAPASTCPTGFIVVPGSTTYGTSDFCVMKYEAKADANGDGTGDTTYDSGYGTWPADSYPISSTIKLVSSAQGYPVVSISQADAITAASSYTKDCTNCHLITEAEWMTIAQNVLSVASNWSGGVVGNGFIYSGHNDGTPYAALTASTDDNGYYDTGQTTGSNQRRTLTLTNGEVIWDLAGNVYEWTAGTTQAPTVQPGINGGNYACREWKDITNAGTLPINASPAGTGLANAGTWTSSNGIGLICSDSGVASLNAFFRGGAWDYANMAGILHLSVGGMVTSTVDWGFRVAK